MNTPGNDSKFNGINSDCDTLRELLPAYSIGATDEAETRLVESLLAECPEVANDLQDFMQLSDAMTYTAPPVALPTALHDKLMAAVAQRQATPSILPSAPQSGPTPKTTVRWLTPALARFALAAAAILLILNIVLIARLFNLSDEQQQQEDEIAQLSDELAKQNQFFAALAEGQVKRIDLQSTNGDMLASVIWAPTSTTALLVSNNLPLLETDRTYQLWFIQGNQPISGGVFRVNEAGQGTFIFETPAPLDQYDALGISDEPMTGSETPTTTPIAIGST
ncbi:MAG: anti-sigma factor [Chloroflexi bacterium]|nr:anti-sigma factor [Chloroflexota bacterium]